MKSYLKYQDWLMLTKGKIEVSVGDNLYNVRTNEYETVDFEDTKWLLNIPFDTYFDEHMVEIELPKIDWIQCVEESRNGLLKYLYRGILGNIGIQLFVVSQKHPDKDEYYLHYLKHLRDSIFGNKEFHGTLEECKYHAQLLLIK